MGLVPAVLYESNWLREDGAKLFFFGACFLAVLALARWASRNSESSYEPPPNFAPPIEPETEVPTYVPNPEPGLAPDPDQEVHPEFQIGNIEVRAFYFSQFNALTGPPDPAVFCDELTVDVTHLDTGYQSTWVYTVGTPQGFEALMQEKRWNVLYAPDMFVFMRYDLEAIRHEVVERIRISLSPTPEQAADSAGYTG